METTYNVDYFIKKFKAIPEDNWLGGRYASDDNTRKCALGHCDERTREGDLTANYTPESHALRRLVSLYLDMEISNINDGWENDKYPQETPKQRTLAALQDIKKLQEPEAKERIVYVTVDKDVRELQQKELVTN